jgi:hypothetical protein
MLSGGTGDDVLFGGRGADTFILTAGQAGSKTVYGLQAYDVIRLEGFSSLNQFTSGLAQQGSDVVFSLGGLTVRFVAASLATVASVAQLASGAEVVDDKGDALIAPPTDDTDIFLSDDGDFYLSAGSFDFSRLGRASLDVFTSFADVTSAAPMTGQHAADVFDFSGITGVLPPAIPETWTAAADRLIDPMDAVVIDAVANPVPDMFDFSILDRPAHTDWA